MQIEESTRTIQEEEEGEEGSEEEGDSIDNDESSKKCYEQCT